MLRFYIEYSVHENQEERISSLLIQDKFLCLEMFVFIVQNSQY